MKLTEYLIENKLSQAALGEMLGVTQSAVSQWIERQIVPAEHCPEIEKLSKGAVRCEELNEKVDWGFIRANAEKRSTKRRVLPDRRRDKKKAAQI